MKSYDHKKIEKKWQEAWANANLYQTKDAVSGKDNFYLLVEFPYPSGNLHVGHWYSFAVPDILARKMRMEGKNVLYPIGFDAFGLPAENAAIKNKVNPREWTESNMEYMRKQLRSMGTSFDWSREVITCHPDYYKWTQWLFLQLYKSNLVYRKETMVNWCPNDKTVLANEQVIDGRCERCGAEVVQKEMLQWNIKITEYADRLIDDLEKLDWPEPIKESQRNWIGRSEGAEIDFPLDIGGQKLKFVILHGFQSGPDRPRWIWAKQKLEEMGHEVIIPSLPNPDAPIEKEWVDTALNATTYDAHTVLVGHSLGAVAALKVLERLSQPIGRLVTIGGFVSKNFKDNPRPFEKTFSWSFNGEKIRENVKSITILHDPRDYAVSDLQAKELSELLKTPITLGISTEPHFTGDKEPDVVMWLRPTIRVFTTRPDTLFGATYLVLAPEHPWVTLALGHKTVLKNNGKVATYVEKASKKTELERQTGQKDKTGVKLEGVVAINPATKEKIPLYVADYVLVGYGTGAIMAVPAHDERDFEFAKKFDLPVRQVIRPEFIDASNPPRAGKQEVYRNIVEVFIRKKNGDTLLLFWKGDVWGSRAPVTGIVGGIEQGEDVVAAARWEAAEETGYTKLTHVATLPYVARTRFYAAHKGENRLADATCVVFELESEDHEQVSLEELEKHDPRFVSEKDVARTLNVPDPLFFWNTLIKPEAYTGSGALIHSGEFDNMSVDEAKKKMTETFGRRKTTYKLRDWIVSRQRYWGVPIPVIHCPTCGIVSVPDDQLPVLLPETDDYLPDGKGKSPLAKVASFVQVKCPQCDGDAERETDTLDTFVDSSWYFLRYTDPRNDKEFAAKAPQANWMPVDLYSGGAEHTTMHLLYSRFWHKALSDRGLVADSEPYVRRMNRGIILGPDGQKMSKSKSNVVDPDDVVGRLGADTVRMYLAFIGPYNEVASYPWNPDGVVGIRRFLERAWRAQEFVTESGRLDDKKYSTVDRALHRAIKKVGDDAGQLKFNTAISQLMILLNVVEKEQQLGTEQWGTFLKLLAPFAPHMAEELWHEAGHDSSVHIEQWPAVDPALLQDDEVMIAIQIDGKTRDEVLVGKNANKEETERLAREKIAGRLEGKMIVRTVVVPSRLVNFVTA